MSFDELTLAISLEAVYRLTYPVHLDTYRHRLLLWSHMNRKGFNFQDLIKWNRYDAR